MKTKLSLPRLITRIKIFFTRYFLYFFISASVSIVAVFLYISYQKIDSLKINPFGIVKSYLKNDYPRLESTNGYTNFLFLGIRGGAGDSPNLADTTLLVSYRHSDNQVFLISFPRDLWVPSMQAKINSAYHYGEEASPGAGIALAQSSIFELSGLPVHYTAVVDFQLFKEVIDLFGGVDVTLSESFRDDLFPIPGKENSLPISTRYETIFFEKGLNCLDGENALKFVRSRHSQGEEGTDFARGARQQLVISALEDKMLNLNFLTNTDLVNKLTTLVENKIVTNLNKDLYPDLIQKIGKSYQKKLVSIPLNLEPNSEGVSVLYHPDPKKYKNEWVLMPKDNSWDIFKKYLQFALTSTK